ncbi:MAG: sigma-54 dependent transcriptional regulator [Deltaproteobacteria bacterium]|nr:sigma-54 dependent transcriptional regulator [Deltaproteobacteria bacterium]
MAKILIIDDNRFNSEALRDIVVSMGHEVICASTAAEGLRTALAHPFEIVFLDVQLPDGDGLTLLPQLRATPFASEIIIITGFGSQDGAELAMKNGAWDYIQKPLERSLIELPLVRALQYREARQQRKAPLILKREGIIGSSPQMEASLQLVAQAAASDASVLICGETGTGKELFAQAIHHNGPRAENPFVIVDCASLPPTLIESILFGHEKGAFTGADRRREGLITSADGSTLFLDEIGDLPLSSQKAFLRVLQERRYRPLGAKEEYNSDFRVIAATNRNLAALVREGKFREDLLFRLRGITIELPPLRERPADIRELTFHYMNRICLRQGMELKGFSPEMLEALTFYGWPGNVRELVNAMESSIAAALDDPILYPKHLPMHIRVHLARRTVDRKEETSFPPPEIAMESLKAHRQAVFAREERQYLEKLLHLTNGHIEKCCQIAGLNRARLYQLIKKHGLGILRSPGEKDSPSPRS